MTIQLQPAVEKDYEFAYRVKKDAMGPHIKLKWGWDETLQCSIHRQRWEEKPWQLILVDAMAIGTVSVSELNGAKRFGEFYILQAYRNKGIGNQVLTQFLAECDMQLSRVSLEYLKWNPVGSLYKRHGFYQTGENDIHYFMARDPQG